MQLLNCYEPGAKALLQKTENANMADHGRDMREKVDPELFFVIDEKNHTIEMTDKGHDLISGNMNDPHFFEIPDVGSIIADLENQIYLQKKNFSEKMN